MPLAMFAFLLFLEGNPSSSVKEQPEVRAQAELQVLHPKVREESYIWAIWVTLSDWLVN